MCLYIAIGVIFSFFFFFKQKTAYEMLRSLVGSEMCIRDSFMSANEARQDPSKLKVGDVVVWKQNGASHVGLLLSLIHI